MTAARPIATSPAKPPASRGRCRRRGSSAGDRVAYLCPNIPELLIAHFAVPLAGAVLVAINSRLAGEEVRYICDHSGAKLLVVDSELRSIVAPVQDRARDDRGDRHRHRPCVRAGRSGGARRPQLPGPARAWIRRAAGLDGRGRAGHDHDQLHVGDHRKAQGRHVHPPGRLLEQPRGGDPLRASGRLRLPVDAPDVPLQRVVHGLGRDRNRRPPGVPARGARRPTSGSSSTRRRSRTSTAPPWCSPPWPARRTRTRWSDRWW